MGIAAESTPNRSLLALSKRNHTLAIVDPTTLQVIARAPVGPDPHEVIASSDGKKAYVSIYGGGRYHALSVNRPGRTKGAAGHRYRGLEWSSRGVSGQEDVKKSISLKFRLNRNVCRRPSGRL